MQIEGKEFHTCSSSLTLHPIVKVYFVSKKTPVPTRKKKEPGGKKKDENCSKRHSKGRKRAIKDGRMFLHEACKQEKRSKKKKFKYAHLTDERNAETIRNATI